MQKKSILVNADRLSFAAKTYRCAVGKGGFSAHKKEGDGCTPIGVFALRECWYRADRLSAPKTGLPLKIIQENDGWCDDPKSAEYNKHITLPSPPGRGQGEGGATRENSNILHRPHPSPLPGGEGMSFEYLFRADHVYDLIIPLGYNDNPVVPGRGSAIFLHLAHEDYRPTEGCIALAKPDLIAILPHIDTNTVIDIKETL